MTNEEKAKQIRAKLGIYADAYYGALQMAEWKVRQLKYILTAYHKWLDQRGFFEPHQQYDPEHQVETFLADILPQRMKEE